MRKVRQLQELYQDTRSEKHLRLPNSFLHYLILEKTMELMGERKLGCYEGGGGVD